MKRMVNGNNYLIVSDSFSLITIERVFCYLNFCVSMLQHAVYVIFQMEQKHGTWYI